jgi:hypothetical protein
LYAFITSPVHAACSPFSNTLILSPNNIW